MEAPIFVFKFFNYIQKKFSKFCIFFSKIPNNLTTNSQNFFNIFSFNSYYFINIEENVSFIWIFNKKIVKKFYFFYSFLNFFKFYFFIRRRKNWRNKIKRIPWKNKKNVFNKIYIIFSN